MSDERTRFAVLSGTTPGGNPCGDMLMGVMVYQGGYATREEAEAERAKQVTARPANTPVDVEALNQAEAMARAIRLVWGEQYLPAESERRLREGLEGRGNSSAIRWSMKTEQQLIECFTRRHRCCLSECAEEAR